MILKVGDRVFIRFLDCFGHIQKIEIRKPRLILGETKPKKIFRVKKEGFETLACGFTESRLILAEALSDLEILKRLEKYNNGGGMYRSDQYIFEMGCVSWGVGELAGEIFQERELVNWSQVDQDFYYSGLSYCLRADLYLSSDDIPMKSIVTTIEKFSFYKELESGQTYHVESICHGLESIKDKIVVIYGKQITLENDTLVHLRFCREINDFKANFSKVN